LFLEKTIIRMNKLRNEIFNDSLIVDFILI